MTTTTTHPEPTMENDLSPTTQARIQAAAIAILAFFAALAVYAILACAGTAPAMPWSPLGHAQQIEQEPASPYDLGQYDMPDGWGPALPVDPQGVNA